MKWYCKELKVRDLLFFYSFFESWMIDGKNLVVEEERLWGGYVSNGLEKVRY